MESFCLNTDKTADFWLFYRFEQIVQRWMEVYVRVDLAVKPRNNYELCLQGISYCNF